MPRGIESGNVHNILCIIYMNGGVCERPTIFTNNYKSNGNTKKGTKKNVSNRNNRAANKHKHIHKRRKKITV